MKKDKIKVYIYTRVSTTIQVDGYSLDAQKARMKAFAEYNDYKIVGEYEDAGKSGKSIEGRLEFNRMMEDIKSGKDGVSYVLVFKLSRFGRNAADVLSTLQVMQDFGVNLICVEDGIDSSKDAGKLMISVLSAVAEIERENIRVQTMEGRIQKAREGKWNGGFAPYGYRLENGELSIADDEVEVVRVIFDRFIHTNDGVAGIARYLNTHGYVKKLRQNGTIPKFSAVFVRGILDNPIYCGKIAFGRRKVEKKLGTRNEMHVVKQSEFPVYIGQHEAIVSEDDWNLAQTKRQRTTGRREKVRDPDHAHILSGILKCPCCGRNLYGNVSKAHSKDNKTRYYYFCKSIRVTELVTLKLTDVNMKLGFIECHDGDRVRTVPVAEVAQRALSRYITEVRDDMSGGSDYLFFNCKGAPMSRQGFWKIIKYYAAKAGIDKDITQHMIRHSFASHMLNNGADIKSVQEMLGHVDIATTQIYLTNKQSKLKEEYAKA